MDYGIFEGADNRDLSYLKALMDKPGVGKSVENDKFPKGEDGHSLIHTVFV